VVQLRKKETRTEKEFETLDATQSKSGEIAEQNKKPEQPVEVIVPSKYHKYLKVFDKASSDILPPHRPYDCKIEIIEGAQLKKGPVYPMSNLELQALKVWLQEMEAKGHI
jgi:hypothetical protein